MTGTFDMFATKLMWLVIIVVLDVAMEVVAALRTNTFEWVQIADVLKDFGQKALAWVALEAIDLMPEEFKFFGGIQSVLGTGAFGLIMASYLASIIGHIQEIGLLPSMPKFGLPSPSRTYERKSTRASGK